MRDGLGLLDLEKLLELQLHLGQGRVDHGGQGAGNPLNRLRGGGLHGSKLLMHRLVQGRREALGERRLDSVTQGALQGNQLLGRLGEGRLHDLNLGIELVEFRGNLAVLPVRIPVEGAHHPLGAQVVHGHLHRKGRLQATNEGTDSVVLRNDEVK